MVCRDRTLARFQRRAPSAAAVLALCFASCPVGAQTAARKIVRSLDDLPRSVYRIPSSAEDLLLADDATFKGFAKEVKSHLELIFDDYDIQDRRVLMSLLSHKLDLEMLFGEDQEALWTCDRMTSTTDRPEFRAMGCFSDDAFLRARIATGRSSGTAFRREYERLLRTHAESMPWSVVAERVKKVKDRFENLSREFVIGKVRTDIESLVGKTHTLDDQSAWRVIFWRGVLDVDLPQRDIVLSVLTDYIGAHEPAKPPGGPVPPRDHE